MTPYVPTTQPMKGEEQEALIEIFEQAHWYTPTHRLRLANEILAAGFHRTVPQKVTRTQLWSYAIETVILTYCAIVVFAPGLMFVFGMLCAAAAGSALSFVGGLIINHGIEKGFRP